MLVSSPGLGLGVVELRLVPTPLSGGEDVPFTIGLPAGVWVKNTTVIRTDKVPSYVAKANCSLYDTQSIYRYVILRNVVK